MRLLRRTSSLGAAEGRREVFALCFLALLLPYEPLRLVGRVLGLEITGLELAAGAVLGAVGVSLAVRGRLRALAESPLLGLALLFLGACLASTAFAEPPRVLPLKATFRLAAGVAAFMLTSLAVRRTSDIEDLLNSLAISGTVVAVVGLAEALGARGTDAWIGLFRQQDFEVGGKLRLASTFPYPNMAAGFLVLSLPGALLAAVRDSSSRVERVAGWVATGLMFIALLLTYSRGALLGALCLPLPLWLWARRQGQRGIAFRARTALAGFAALSTLVIFSSESYRLRTVSEGDTSWYSARFTSEASRLVLAPGELMRTPVLVRNTGKMTWKAEGEKRVHVSYRWFDLASERGIDLVDIEGERTALPTPVEPAESVRVLAFIRAPSTEGHYLLVWDMVQEHTTWFSEKSAGRDSLSVTVGRPIAKEARAGSELLSSLLNRSWRPGRLELWSLAWSLFIERPVLGVGPDNFRWRYGPQAGRPHWDTRTYANSLYLETLATTGLAGTTVLLSLLGSALLRLYRLWDDAFALAPVLTAALGGFLVHGLFDYLLEATSMYLAFWILLGAVSAFFRESRRGSLATGSGAGA